jgi:hypothetical protein
MTDEHQPGRGCLGHALNLPTFVDVAAGGYPVLERDDPSVYEDLLGRAK